VPQGKAARLSGFSAVKSRLLSVCRVETPSDREKPNGTSSYVPHHQQQAKLSSPIAVV
jgi:hypothetical protein